MAKSLIESPLTTKNARKDLGLGVHWRGVDADVHLGYRKGKRGGVWLVRWRVGTGYKQEGLGVADDVLAEGTLDYEAAKCAAKKLVVQSRLDAHAAAVGPELTVKGAVENYIAMRNDRAGRRVGRTIRSDAAQRLSRYLLGQAARGKQPAIPPSKLSNIALHRLTDRDLLEWRDGLPATLKASSLQRTVNDLRAALMRSFGSNRDRLPLTLPAIITFGLKTSVDEASDENPIGRDNQILSDGQIGSLLAAAKVVDEEEGLEGDLYRLLLTLAATGGRFSQLSRMRVRDCQIAQRRLLIPTSRKGRGQKLAATAVPVGLDIIEALIPVVLQRRPNDPLFERWRHEQIAGSIHWQRTERGAWRSASEITRAWQHIRSQAGLPEVVPYCFRHSSIVRGIRQNLPVRLVAALHDTSIQMIERHYSRYIVDGLEDIARNAIVNLTNISLENSMRPRA